MGNSAGIKLCSKPHAKKYKCVLYFFLNLINLDTSKSVQGEVKKRVSRETMPTDIIKGKKYISIERISILSQDGPLWFVR